MLQLPCQHACIRRFTGSRYHNLSSRKFWARHLLSWPGAQHASGQPLRCVRTKVASIATKDAQTAEAAVDAGLQKLKQKKWDAALQLFERGLEVGQHGPATAGLESNPFPWHWQPCSQHRAPVCSSIPRKMRLAPPSTIKDAATLRWSSGQRQQKLCSKPVITMACG